VDRPIKARLVITGTTTSNNSRWAFSATGSTTTTFGTTVTNNPPNGLSTTAPSTITITNLPSIADLRVRIELNANATSENWIIDDLIISGDFTTPAGLSVCPSRPHHWFNYLLGSGPSAKKNHFK
jgi:hypothetical protein